jgi:putative nucleotidyltransferase with HDIG domain
VSQDQAPGLKQAGYFFPVPPLMLFPQTSGDFAVYLKQDGLYVLYTKARDVFTQQTKQRLSESGVSEVYVLREQKEAYQRYIEQNLGRILDNEDVPMAERARVFYDASLGVVKEALETRLPAESGLKLYQRLADLVRDGVRFLGKSNALKSLAGLISHDYKTYSHSLQVFMYTVTVLHTFGLARDELVQVGVGCLLHDIGKTSIPPSILNKPGKLNPREWERIRDHPVVGAAMVSHLPLVQQSVNCVLFHHEKYDGTGYPAGMKGDQLVLPVRVLSVADVYDALTTNRSYAQAVSPFQALQIMREEMPGHFDMEIYRRLVLVLSGADIV